MKYLLFIAGLIYYMPSMYGQNESMMEKGTVSYLSSQNTYVKFENTKSITIGDTLYIKQGDQFIPVLKVSNKSSISCICTPLRVQRLQASNEVFTKNKIPEKEKEPLPKEEEIDEKEKEWRLSQAIAQTKTALQKQQQGSIYFSEKELKQNIRGRISAASYNHFSSANTNYRMRYSFSLQGNNLNNSKLSVNSYITFRHTLNEWENVKANLGDALKVYALSAQYDFNKLSSLSFGRKINAKISSMGAIDGIQYERGLGRKLIIGAIAGSRPDFNDYSLNLNLLQAGFFISQVAGLNKAYRQSTLAIIEQRNHFKVDRRFVFFQHSSTPLKNLNLFGSMELDLYKRLNDEEESMLRLTNLFTSIRYKFTKKLSLSLSYDNRRNIIYYESYKNFIDRLIENETRQGLRAQMTYRPFKYFTWGVGTSFRFQKNGNNHSNYINTYLNFSKLPGNISATLTANMLHTNYIESKTIGIRASSVLVKGKINGDIYIRMANFKYKYLEQNARQYISGINFNFKILKKLSFNLYYEGTLDQQNRGYTQLHTKITQRF